MLLSVRWWTSYATGNKTVKSNSSNFQEHTPVYHEGGWIIARASLHNHTVLSDGKNTLEDELELAKKTVLAILIPGVKTMLIRNGKVIKEVEGSKLEYTERIWSIPRSRFSTGLKCAARTNRKANTRFCPASAQTSFSSICFLSRPETN